MRRRRGEMKINGLQVVIGMIIFFLLWVAITTFAIVNTGKLIDEGGGVKAIVERVWEGKK